MNELQLHLDLLPTPHSKMLVSNLFRLPRKRSRAASSVRAAFCLAARFLDPHAAVTPPFATGPRTQKSPSVPCGRFAFRAARGGGEDLPYHIGKVHPRTGEAAPGQWPGHHQWWASPLYPTSFSPRACWDLSIGGRPSWRDPVRHLDQARPRTTRPMSYPDRRCSGSSKTSVR